MECKCEKEKDLEDMGKRLRHLEVQHAESRKDILYFKESLDKLNQTLDELKRMIAKINEKPLVKYEKVALIIVSSIIAFAMGKVLS